MEPLFQCINAKPVKILLPAPAECKSWRTKDGGCCVFPFRYQGGLRDSCVFDGQLWCSVTGNYDVDKLKGICEGETLFNESFLLLCCLLN